VKLVCTGFLAVQVPFYAVVHGWANFLWFSNVAMLSLLVIVWRESSLLASTICALTLLPELGWNISFFSRLLLGVDLLGVTGYMFDPSIPLVVRGMSLYHVPLPFLLVWMVRRLGYDPRALKLATLMAWVILPATFLVASPEYNINWVYGLQEDSIRWVPAPVHLGFMMILYPVLMVWPAHRLLQHWHPDRPLLRRRRLNASIFSLG
jgi:hypothetical protein